MIEIEYDPDNGIALKDGQVEAYYNEYIRFYCENLEKYQTLKPTFSTEPIFTRIRLGVVRNEIPHDSIIFIYKGEKIPINRDGLVSWPKGFLDQSVRMHQDILRGIVAKRKAEEADE